MRLFKAKIYCGKAQIAGKITQKGYYSPQLHPMGLGKCRHTTLAFYVSNLSSVGPEIEAAPGLSSLLYYCLLYFPLHSVLQTALSDVRMQPPGINWACVCLMFLQGQWDVFVWQQSQLVSHYCVISQDHGLILVEKERDELVSPLVK